jgi:hypothetical protein
VAVFAGGVGERAHVFGEARAAVAGAGEEEVVADSGVGADAGADFFDVGADALGEVGELVHEADLGREQRIGGVLGQLARSHVHELHAVAGAGEGFVELVQDFAGGFAVGGFGGADDDAVGFLEVVDGVAFFEEFGVGADDVALAGMGGDEGGDAVCRADGHGGFGEHDLEAVDEHVLTGGEGFADGGGDLFDVGHLGLAVVALGGADGDEDDGAFAAGAFDVGGEAEAAGFVVALHDGFEAGFEEGDLALFEAGDLGGVDVGAEDVVADVGEAGADDEADVAAADDGDSHGVGLRARGRFGRL